MLARYFPACEYSGVMPKFRLKKLRVGEVSLVDKPAIEREFLVIKTDEYSGEEDMSEKNTAQRAIDALKSLAGLGDSPPDDKQDDGKPADDAIKSETKSDEKAKTPEKSEGKVEVTTDAMIAEAVSKSAAETRAAVTKEYDEKMTEMQKSVDEMQIKTATAEFRQKVVDWPGDAGANADLCVKMSGQLDDETFKTWFEGQSASAALLAESRAIGGGLFDDIGKSGDRETIGTAVEKVLKAVADVEVDVKDGNVIEARRKAIKGIDYVKAQNEIEDAKPARK